MKHIATNANRHNTYVVDYEVVDGIEMMVSIECWTSATTGHHDGTRDDFNGIVFLTPHQEQFWGYRRSYYILESIYNKMKKEEFMKKTKEHIDSVMKFKKRG